MILVDTSVWVDHLRQGSAELADLLGQDRVLVHPFIIGEIALGSLRQRAQIIDLLDSLPAAPVATHTEVMHCIVHHELYGQGIGYMDVHLLASVMLDGSAWLWTGDKRLHGAAARLGLAA